MNMGWGEIPQKIQTISHEAVEQARQIEADPSRLQLWTQKMAGILVANMLASGLIVSARMDNSVEANTNLAVECQGGAQCYVVEEDPQVLAGERRGAEKQPAAPTLTKDTPIVPAQQQPKPQQPAEADASVVSAASARAESLRAGLNPETAARIEAMNLSLEGYKTFLSNIDTSLMEYAKQYPEFDPARNGFDQSKQTEWTTSHHTAFYANADGPGNQPVGEANAKGFVDFIAKRYDNEDPADHRCCAVQFFNDRNGKIWQFTPTRARVRHDKGYESISIGLETEGLDDSFSTKQYESIVYWHIATLSREGLLKDQPLEKRMRGHEETRTEYNATSGKREPHKQDMGQDIMTPLRQRAAILLSQHPEIYDIKTNIA